MCDTLSQVYYVIFTENIFLFLSYPGNHVITQIYLVTTLGLWGISIPGLNHCYSFKWNPYPKLDQNELTLTPKNEPNFIVIIQKINPPFCSI